MQRIGSPSSRRITGVKGASINTDVKPVHRRHNNAPVIHNIDAVVRWIPVMGHPCFELGFIEDNDIPHTTVHKRYPYPIRNIESKNIVRITPKYFEDYIKIVLDHQTCNLHRIYLSTLQPIYASGMVVDHIDRDTHNNLMSNLRWLTVSENNKNKASRRKYFRTLLTEELPDGLVPVEGTNALLDTEELFVYTPIGKKDNAKEYREFDAALNTVEVYIRPNGELKISYNPKIARTTDGLYVSASQILYKAHLPYETIQRIKQRRRLLKSPEYINKLKRLIDGCAFVKGCSDKFIIDFDKIDTDPENIEKTQ